MSVRRSSDNAVVFKGKLTPAQADANSGDQVQAADFSAFAAGRDATTSRFPAWGEVGTSALAPNVFEHTYYMAMRGFYGQRCGTAVDMGPEFPGFSHPACHLHGEFSPTSGESGASATTSAAGTTRATMAATWSTPASPPARCCGPGRSTAARIKNISLKIPESGNGTPDILNEARWNLEWMLKMQDDDGGVWHKQTSEHFSGFISPEDDKLPSEVIGTGSAPYKSTCATADLAAVGAIAARVYKPFDAQVCRAGARTRRAEHGPGRKRIRT